MITRKKAQTELAAIKAEITAQQNRLTVLHSQLEDSELYGTNEIQSIRDAAFGCTHVLTEIETAARTLTA